VYDVCVCVCVCTERVNAKSYILTILTNCELYVFFTYRRVCVCVCASVNLLSVPRCVNVEPWMRRRHMWVNVTDWPVVGVHLKRVWFQSVHLYFQETYLLFSTVCRPCFFCGAAQCPVELIKSGLCNTAKRLKYLLLLLDLWQFKKNSFLFVKGEEEKIEE